MELWTIKRINKTKLYIQFLTLLPSSELEPLGRPLGWYFICTLRFMPEKWPYLIKQREIWDFNKLSLLHHFFLTHISKTLFNCSNLLFFSSISGLSFVSISAKRKRAMSKISCNCLGRFNLTWPFLKPSYFSKISKNLKKRELILNINYTCN